MSLLWVLAVALLMLRQVGEGAAPDAYVQSDTAAALLGVALPLAGALVGWLLARRAGARRSARVTPAAAALLALGGFAVALFALGWLERVQALVGTWVLLPDVVALVPLVVAVVLVVRLDIRRAQDRYAASLPWRAAEGLPVPPVPGPWRMVAWVLRVQLPLALVPMLLALGALEAWQLAAPAVGTWMLQQGNPPPTEAQVLTLLDIASLLCAGAALVLCPPLVVWAMGARALPAHPASQALVLAARSAGVHSPQPLLWDTHGLVMNAFALGLVPGLRAMVVSDALVTSLPSQQVQAVVAHEAVHLSRRHTVLLAGTVLVLAWAVWLAAEWPVAVGALAPGGLLAVMWVSRRVELHADAGAAAALSQYGCVDAGGIAAMDGALVSVTHMAGVSQHKRSWRHGTVAWRRRHLASLLGQRAGHLHADRVVARLWLAVGAALLALAAATAWRAFV